MVQNYTEFCSELLKSGFSMGGGNDKGIYAVVPFDWKQQPDNTPVRWHTGDPDTDPWEWRIRVLNERVDIAYAKVFFKASGFITKKWYSDFVCVRRNGKDYKAMRADGEISEFTDRVYDVIARYDGIPMHEIKTLGGFSSEDKARFDKAIVDLQMKMLITMCGSARKRNKQGEEYGWNSMVLCTVESFWREEAEKAVKLDPKKSFEKIRKQVLKLNPLAEESKIKRFILG